MKALERFFFGSVDPIRPYLLQKGLLLLIAFDCWIDLLPHGGRYGAGDFNVAHFRWLDWVLPNPSPSLYNGVLSLTGLLALTQVFLRPTRAVLLSVFVLFTYGWAMSMLDSYQHHYLLSLLLLCVAFFPRLAARDLWPRDRWTPDPDVAAGGATEGNVPATGNAGEGPAELPIRGGASRRAKKRRRKRGAKASSPSAEPEEGGRPKPLRALSAWAYVLLGSNLSIVYFFTAVTKTSPDWREGSPLASLAQTELFRSLETYLAGHGWTRDETWSAIATSTVFLQLGISAGYLLASTQDRCRTPWLRYFVWPAVLLPLSFHLAVEHMNLNIGWFSAYVIFAALVFYSPAALLRAVARAITWPFRRGLAWLERWLADDPTRTAVGSEGPRPESPVTTIGLAGAVGILVALLLRDIDLPGTLEAGVILGAASVVVALRAARRKHPELARPWLVAVTLAGVAFWIAISEGNARFDYYRWAAGDHRRRGEYQEALEAYIKANRYAPPGQDRKAKEEQMQRLLERRGAATDASAP